LTIFFTRTVSVKREAEREKTRRRDSPDSRKSSLNRTRQSALPLEILEWLAGGCRGFFERTAEDFGVLAFANDDILESGGRSTKVTSDPGNLYGPSF